MRKAYLDCCEEGQNDGRQTTRARTTRTHHVLPQGRERVAPSFLACLHHYPICRNLLLSSPASAHASPLSFSVFGISHPSPRSALSTLLYLIGQYFDTSVSTVPRQPVFFVFCHSSTSPLVSATSLKRDTSQRILARPTLASPNLPS